MLKPIVNKNLSLRARALFFLFAEKGRVISADELVASKEVLEGRDAIQAAINELKDYNYIRTVRTRNNNHWISKLKFTDSALKLISPDNGFSGHLYSYATTSDLSTSTNIDNNPNGLLSMGAEPLKEEKMVWKEEEDEAVGAVGKIDDRQARLNAKYKKPVKAQRSSRDRINTPEELWSTPDLLAEFYDLSDKHASNMTGQVNGKYLSAWINKQVGEGTTRYEVLKAIRMFFEDPRNLHDVGVGKTLWQRFIGYYQGVQGIVKAEEVVYADDDFKAHQEKMLKLLGGE